MEESLYHASVIHPDSRPKFTNAESDSTGSHFMRFMTCLNFVLDKKALPDSQP